MPLSIRTCPVQFVERVVHEWRADEVLAVMPRAECDGLHFRWPRVGVPRTIVEVSDLGCGELASADEIADILRHHPELVPPNAAHVAHILRVGKRALDRAAGREWRLLVHCHGGVSRSVAAALLILALEDGPGREGESVARLRDAYGFSDPQPNSNLTLLGDRALGRGGALYAAALGASPPQPMLPGSPHATPGRS